MEETGMNSITAAHRHSVPSTGTHIHSPVRVTHSPQPVSQRVIPPDKTDPGIDVLAGRHQTVTFSVDQCYQGRVQLSGGDCGEQDAGETPTNNFVAVGQFLRPKSPTRQCAIPDGDGSHFSLALMGSKVGSEESERIFHVQKHEMICAVASQTSFVDNEGHVVSSVDIDYYWCNFCTFSTSIKTLLMKHVMEHRFHCRHCRYQSFCRADIIHHSHHSHPQFKDTALSLRYCTMLSDYLRLACPKEGPLDPQRKRKRPPDDGCVGCNQSLSKVRRAGCGSAKRKTREQYSADYVVFDVDVEDRVEVTQDPAKEGTLKETASKSSSPPPLEEVREVETPLSEESVCASSSSVVFTRSDLLQESRPASESTSQSTLHLFSSTSADDQTAVQTSLESVCPPDLMPEAPPPDSFEPPVRCSNSSGFSAASRLSTPSPPDLSSVGTESLQQGPSEWVCAYCPFTSASHLGIRSHCKRHHRRRNEFHSTPPTQAEEHSAPPLIRFDDRAVSASAADEDCEMACSEESAFPVSQMVSVADEVTVENALPDEPPVLVKQKPVNFDTAVVNVEVRVPVPHIPAESPSELKCLHCSHRSHLPHDLRSHILLCHKGESLSGVDARKNAAFICPQTTFTSCSDQAFLSHTQECTERPELKPADFPQVELKPTDFQQVELKPADTPQGDLKPTDTPQGELKQEPEKRVECVRATARQVEQSNGSSSSSATRRCKENMDDFSCIHCNHSFVSQKEEMKRHVLDHHAAMLLVMRNVYAHRKRKKSYVYFCRWCPWEGEKKDNHKMHDLICKHKPKPAVLSAEQAPSGLSCGPKDVEQQESSIVFPSNDAGAVCLPRVEDAGEGNCVEDVCLVLPVPSSWENSTEMLVTVQDTRTAPHAHAADQHKPDIIEVDLEKGKLKTLGIPHPSAAADSLELAGQLKTSQEAFDLTSSLANFNVTHENMCQVLVCPDHVIVEQDENSAHLPHNADMADNGTCPSGVVPDVKSSDNSVESSDTLADSDKRSNSVKTDPLPHIDIFHESFKTDALPFQNSFKTETSPTCMDFNAVTNQQHTDSILSGDCSANVTIEHPPGVRLEIPTAGNNTSQSCTVPPHVGTFEYRICPSPPDMKSSDGRNPAAVSPALVSADSSDSSSSTDTVPLDSDRVNSVCAALIMPDSVSMSTNSVYSSQVSSDAEVSPNPGIAAWFPHKRSGSTDRLLEEKAHASYTSATVDGPDGSLEPAHKPQSLLPDPASVAQKFPCRIKRQKAAKGVTFHKTKRLKNTWNNAYNVMCSGCELEFHSMKSLKKHMLNQHRRVVAVPFRSPHHRAMHYKSKFFACPSKDCMVYNYSEAYVVSHYRRSHHSQPHPYTDPDYTPAPVKSRRRTSAKAKETQKWPNKVPTEAGAPHVAKDPIESADQLYMCLYCDRKLCTDTLAEMKAHYLSCHMGQAITVRDVNAHREKRPSRFYMCDQAGCDFCTYEQPVLNNHGETCHSEQLLALADRSYQCGSCGWTTSEDASVRKHVSAMHQSDGGATVVTLAHGDEQQAVEERYIQCGSLKMEMH